MNAALGVIGALLLVDVATETFLSGAPARWGVAGLVAAYLGTAGVMRGRGRRSAALRPPTPFIALLGVIAASAWMSEGLTNGAVVLRQPTASVLAGATGLCLGLAVIVILQAPWVPVWARAVFAVTAVYGMAAFAAGMAEGTPYPDLLRGHSLWRRLPPLLQGASVASLIAIPAALVAALVEAVRAKRAAAGLHWRLRQTLALSLAAVMIVSGVTIRGGTMPGYVSRSRADALLAAAHTTSNAAASYREISRELSGGVPMEPATVEELTAQMERTFPALQAVADAIPRDTFDIAAVVERAGRDPGRLHEWVRDQTYLVPYRGALRGATGVLMDRLGNSLDRALLLHAMLLAAGHTARLATGKLNDEQAAALLSSVRPVPPEGVSALATDRPDPTDAVLRAYAQQHQLPDSTLQQALDQMAAQQQHMRDVVRQRVREQTARLLQAVERRPPVGAEGSVARDALSDHWWVEWQEGNVWTALDPSLPHLAPGAALTTPSRVVMPNQVSDLGAEQVHRIQLRVVIESWNEGRVSETAALAHDLVPADLIGKSILVRFVPVAWPSQLSLFTDPDPLAKFRSTVLEQRQWLPILQIDGADVSTHSFTDAGELKQGTRSGYAGAMDGLTRRFDGLLGGQRTRGDASRPQSAHLTAVWLEYGVHVAGRPVRVERREVFDLLGPAARASGRATSPVFSDAQRLERGLALMGETEILPLAGWLSPQFASYLLATQFVANGGALLALGRGAASGDRGKDPTSAMRRFPMELYALALARQQWSRVGAGVYLDAPNVLSYHRRPQLEEPRRLLMHRGFDIVVNDVAVPLRSTRSAFDLRLEQGVLDTNAEAVLARLCGDEPPGVRCGAIHNVAEAFSGGTASWLTWRDAQSARWDALGIAGDLQTRIEADLAAGYTVIVGRPPTASGGGAVVGWWRIEPRSGQTLGIGPRGWGQASIEARIWDSAFTFGVVFAVCGLASLLAVEQPPGSTPILVSTGQTMSGLQMVRCGLVAAGGAVALGFVGGFAAGAKAVGALIGALLAAVDRGISMNPNAR